MATCSKIFSITVEENDFAWGVPVYNFDPPSTVVGTFDGYDWTTDMDFNNAGGVAETRIQNSGTGPYSLSITNYRLRIVVTKTMGANTDLLVLAVFSTTNLGQVYVAERGYIVNPPISVDGTYDFFFTIPTTAGDTLQIDWEALYSVGSGAFPQVIADIDVNLSIVP